MAPRPLGGDDERGVVVMEAPPGVRSLDQSLLGWPGPASWARLRAGTMGTATGFAAAGARRGCGRLGSHGVDPEAVAADLNRIGAVLSTSHVALVHGDPCPDNVLITSVGCRLIDYERASMAAPAGVIRWGTGPRWRCRGRAG